MENVYTYSRKTLYLFWLRFLQKHSSIRKTDANLQTFSLTDTYYTGARASIPTKINPTSGQNLFISHEAKNQNTIVYSNTQLIVI